MRNNSDEIKINNLQEDTKYIQFFNKNSTQKQFAEKEISPITGI